MKVTSEGDVNFRLFPPSGKPGQDDNRCEHGNAYISQPEMPAVELRGGGFMLL